MKVFLPESPIEKKLQKLEEFMIKNKIKIEWQFNGLVVSDEVYHVSGFLMDVETKDKSTQLPRTLESERICFNE